MLFENLSEEAKECVMGMVEHCVNQGIYMGMDEGFEVLPENGCKGKKHAFRKELEAFCGLNSD